MATHRWLILSVSLACATSATPLLHAQAVRPDSRIGQPAGASRATLPAARPAPPAEAPAANGNTASDPIETIVPTSRVSNSISSAITAGLPKYQAPKPPPPPNQSAPQRRRDPGEEEIDEGEALPEATPIAADQPKNKIIRLPKYVVEADRPPIFKEREILTKRALAELAVRRYLSRFDSKVLNRFRLPFIGISPEDRAMAMYGEDVRLENISELKDAAAAARRGGDKAGSDYILRETNNTFLRSGGMDWTTRRND